MSGDLGLLLTPLAASFNKLLVGETEHQLRHEQASPSPWFTVIGVGRLSPDAEANWKRHGILFGAVCPYIPP